jgi:hypothetical protein
MTDFPTADTDPFDMTDDAAELELAEAFDNLARGLRQDRQSHIGSATVRTFEGKLLKLPLN